MMRSLFSGVSGLKNHQTRMDVIGNNISNINTIGFKSSRTTFSDMLSQTQSSASAPSANLGGTNPKQVGLGSSVASVDMIFTDGSAQATGKNTDVTLNGNGLFVLKNGNNTFYSRDGAFEFDTNGNFVLPGSGLFVQGWNAIDGNLNTNGATENIMVKSGQTMPGTATTTVDYTGNVNSADPIITGITYTAGGGTADPDSVIQYKRVTDINVLQASNFTYDARIMTINVTDTNGNQIPLTSDQTTTDADGNETTTTVNNFEQGETYAITGSNATKIEGYTIGRIDYSVDRTVTTIDGDQTVTLTLSNGATVTLSANTTSATATAGSTVNLTLADGTTQTVTPTADTTYNVGDTYGTSTIASFSVTDTEGNTTNYPSVQAGQQYTMGAALSDTVNYDATTMEANSDATITKIAIRDSSNKITTYPIAVSYSAGNKVKLTYEDNSIETITNGSYSVNENVFNTVNVDGVNVIAATLTLSDGTSQKVTSGFYERNHSVPITTVITVYDSEGNAHAVSVLIDKDKNSDDQSINADALSLARVVDEDGTRINYESLERTTDDAGNLKYKYTLADGSSETVDPDQVTWDNRWRVYMAPATGIAGPTYKFSQTEADGSTTAGFLNVVLDEATNNPVDGAPSYIYFNEDGSYSGSATAGGSLYTVYSDGNGASPTTSSIGFDSTTQYAGNTTVYGVSDGNAYGVLQSVQIDSAGIISGTYSNGIIRNEAQIAVAQFVNSGGLTKTGTSLYQESNNSGTPNVKTVDALGLSLTPSSLEMSNVDLANELADMIVTQRGFQSNSKIITVGDEMLETIVNMKR